MVRKSGKAGYQQSYPHYPHFFPLKREVYIVKLKTCVLYKSDKILFCEKSEEFLLTSLMSKYNVNYLKIVANNDNYSQPEKQKSPCRQRMFLPGGNQFINRITLSGEFFFIFRHNIAPVHI